MHSSAGAQHQSRARVHGCASIESSTIGFLGSTFSLELVKVGWLLAAMGEPAEPLDEDV
jgi:hypothetical protein